MDKEQKVVVTGFLYHKGKVLIVKRNDEEEFLSGHYELPGGKVDFGESPEESLKKKFLSEVNLAVSVSMPFATFTYISHNGKRHTIEIIYLVRLMNEKHDIIMLSPKHTEYLWVSSNEIHEYFSSLDYTKAIFKKGFTFVNV